MHIFLSWAIWSFCRPSPCPQSPRDFSSSSLSPFPSPQTLSFWLGILGFRGIISVCMRFETILQKGPEAPHLLYSSPANCFSHKGGHGHQQGSGWWSGVCKPSGHVHQGGLHVELSRPQRAKECRMRDSGAHQGTSYSALFSHLWLPHLIRFILSQSPGLWKRRDTNTLVATKQDVSEDTSKSC